MKENSFKFYIYIILIFFGFLMFFPFIWMFISSFKGISDIYTYPPKIFPKKWIFANYKEVLDMIPFLRYYLNSIFVATSSTFLQVFVSILAAFAFARLKFPGKNVLFMLYLGTLIMPPQVTLIPKFLIVANLKWLDSYQGLIIPILFNAFSIFFLRQFFYSIPKELEDAAKIDGCGHFTFLFKIVIPLSKPAIGTIALFSFLMEWRSYIWPLIIINSSGDDYSSSFDNILLI